jgi:SAM-dependent methyltransferase
MAERTSPSLIVTPFGEPRMYREFADWWPLISAPDDYAEEAAFYARAMSEASQRPVETVLELGCGGGHNASHLKARFRMTLVDRAPGMLAMSRSLNPDCEHIEGDMRSVRLDRQFDAVFSHDAITYMTSEEDLRRAIATAWTHCRPGGAALFAPDHLRETFRAATDHGGHDGPDRAVRYLEWSWDPDPDDTTCIVDYTYVFRHPDGSVQVEWDRHIEGVFPRDTWLRLLSEVGFQPRVVLFDHSELEPGTYELFACTRPA